MRCWLSLLLALLGCQSAPGVDTGLDTADTAALWCLDQPEVTWENFGEGFTRGNCQSCHASTALDRRGAPEGLHFDDREQSLQLAAAIYDTVLERHTMPPAGGISEVQAQQLHTWLTCTPW